MARSRTEAWQHLRSEDARYRRAALHLLGYYWEPGPELGERCEQLAFEDPDADVRHLAMGILGQCYHGSWDARIGRRLAQAVCDEGAPAAWRKAAYAGLLSIRAKLQLDIHTRRFPEDVDWDYVRSFFEQRPAPSEFEKMRTTFPMLEPEVCALLVHQQQVDRALKAKDYEAAASYLTELLNALPTADDYCARGQAFYELGRLDEAIADFSSALQRRPNAATYLLRSRTYSHKGLDGKAQKDWRMAAELDPGITQAE